MALFSSLYGDRVSRELANDDSTILFTTARRKAAVNEGQREFARITKCLERRSTITITGGVAEYDLDASTVLANADFMEWSKTSPEFRYTSSGGTVTVLAGQDLPRRSVDWLHEYEPGWQVSTVASTLQQMPAVWYERFDGGARNFGLWPTPSTGSSASMEAHISYIALDTPMSADANVPFTVGSNPRIDLTWYHQALAHYAASQLEKFRRDYDASKMQLELFAGYVTQYWQDFKHVKGGQSVRPAKTYFTTRTKVKDPRT